MLQPPALPEGAGGRRGEGGLGLGQSQINEVFSLLPPAVPYTCLTACCLVQKPVAEPWELGWECTPPPPAAKRSPLTSFFSLERHTGLTFISGSVSLFQHSLRRVNFEYPYLILAFPDF